MTDKSKLTAERLRIARDKKQWSYGMLSDATGFSKSTLQRYETGFVSNIPVERLKIIGGVLGVRPEWLMGFDVVKKANRHIIITNSELFVKILMGMEPRDYETVMKIFEKTETAMKERGEL